MKRLNEVAAVVEKIKEFDWDKLAAAKVEDSYSDLIPKDDFEWGMINGKDSEPMIKFIPYETFGRYEDVMRRVPSIDKIKTLLNYHPEYTLEEGLKLTIEWQKQQY